MPDILTKKSFGGATIAHISPATGQNVPEAMNIHLTFEEALKLHFGLGQLLGKINSYNRSTTAGRRAAVNLCVYPRKKRITLVEGRLRKNQDVSAEVADTSATNE